MFGTWSFPNTALPPDVILEVGPHPCSTRYAAHGALLAAHSGYLRAALRALDQSHLHSTSTLRRALQQQAPNAVIINSSSESCPPPAVTNAASSVLYLPNVTTEQFSPLLSYMYTGYLDLTMENIFGVLLATHILHMPRALELCRTYLSSPADTNTSPCTAMSGELMQRTYFGPKTDTTVGSNGPRLVRPIASKAFATVGLNFIAPPTAASQINLHPSAPFRSLGNSAQDTLPDRRELELENESNSSSQSPINVTQYEDENVPLLTSPSCSVIGGEIPDKNVSLKSVESEPQPKDSTPNFAESAIKLPAGGRTSKHAAVTLSVPAVKRHKTQTEVTNDGTNGVIIDIASCDGPVRFRRVLNVMYGCNKKNRAPECSRSPAEDVTASCSTDVGGNMKKNASRSLRYASSFHQQMARTISNTGKHISNESSSSSSNSSYQKCDNQHSQPDGQSHPQPQTSLSQDHRQKDENSREDSTSYGAGVTDDTDGHSSYTCVYCKHTFKSHYCYQKHAKRHLIPLRLDSRASSASVSSVPASSIVGSGMTKDSNTASQAKVLDGRRRSTLSTAGNSTIPVKREVKPLDMNVQYYPCKTCGSKFPSYYFVHKHRKLCHTEEEDDATNINSSNSVSNSTAEATHNADEMGRGTNCTPEPQSDMLVNIDHSPTQIIQQG